MTFKIKLSWCLGRGRGRNWRCVPCSWCQQQGWVGEKVTQARGGRAHWVVFKRRPQWIQALDPQSASSDGHCHWADLFILFFSGFKPLVFRLWITLRDRSMYCALNITGTVTFKCTFRPIFSFFLYESENTFIKRMDSTVWFWSISVHIRNATICKNITWSKRNRRFVLLSFQICLKYFGRWPWFWICCVKSVSFSVPLFYASLIQCDVWTRSSAFFFQRVDLNLSL